MKKTTAMSFAFATVNVNGWSVTSDEEPGMKKTRKLLCDYVLDCQIIILLLIYFFTIFIVLIIKNIM